MVRSHINHEKVRINQYAPKSNEYIFCYIHTWLTCSIADSDALFRWCKEDVQSMSHSMRHDVEDSSRVERCIFWLRMRVHMHDLVTMGHGVDFHAQCDALNLFGEDSTYVRFPTICIPSRELSESHSGWCLCYALG